jgi:hypothetical protein
MVAGGDRSQFDQLLQHVSNWMFFLPGRISDENIQLSVRLNVPLVKIGKRIAIPIFSLREQGMNWCADKGDDFSVYEMIPVNGTDLALTLDPKIGMLIDPGAINCVEVLSDEVINITGTRRSGDIPMGQDTLRGTLHMDRKVIGLDDIVDINSKVEEFRFECSNLFKHYPEIIEAICLMPSEGRGVLGILSEELEQKQRFFLISEVGELAERHLGAVGAVEIMIDIDKKQSQRWNELKDAPLLYQRSVGTPYRLSTQKGYIANEKPHRADSSLALSLDDRRKKFLQRHPNRR